MGEQLSTEQEHGNIEDRCAVSVKKGITTVGHAPREISNIF